MVVSSIRETDKLIKKKVLIQLVPALIADIPFFWMGLIKILETTPQSFYYFLFVFFALPLTLLILYII